MKKKCSSTTTDRPSIKKKRRNNSDSNLVEDFIETLSNKKDDVQSIIKDTNFFSKESIETNDLEDFLKNFSSDASEFRNLKGFTSFLWAEELAAKNNAESSFETEEPQHQYRYSFTDSEFLAFVAALDPVEYLIINNIIAVLVASQYNLKELEVIYNFFNNISDILQIVVDQELFQKAIIEDLEAEEKKKALSNDILLLHKQVDELQQHVKQLENLVEP